MVRESKIDLFSLFLFIALIILGWLNLYSVGIKENASLFSLDTFHGRQALWIGLGAAIGLVILLLDAKFIEFISYFVYAASILALIAVLLIGKETNGAASWIPIGPFKLQPTEFAKLATLMALAKYMSRFNFSLQNRQDLLIASGIILFPMLLVLLQNDAGSALVFASLAIVFYRHGLQPLFIVGLLLTIAIAVIAILYEPIPLLELYIGIGLFVIAGFSYFILWRRKYLLLHFLAALYLLGVAFSVNTVTKSYHRARIQVLIADQKEVDQNPSLEQPYYQLLQAKIAIGSGRFAGKGFAKATHTTGDFVPEEHTDYIYCPLAEQFGFWGSAILLLLFLAFTIQLLVMAENSKTAYARIYGYGVSAIIFFHVMINIGMTIGLVPSVGIPLPFFSYGGSATLSFMMMTFVLMNHYAYRTNILA